MPIHQPCRTYQLAADVLAAEEVLVGTASSGAGGGASSDLAQATGLALRDSVSMGLDREDGLLWRASPTNARRLACWSPTRGSRHASASGCPRLMSRRWSWFVAVMRRCRRSRRRWSSIGR